MQRKILYFVNPISGTKRKATALQLIEHRTRQQQIAFEILHTNAAGDYQFLKEKISAEAITDIVICGGDGTVSQVAGALLQVPVNIGIIPLGSGNGLALGAKIPTGIDQALDIIFAGQSQFIDSFYINDRFSCMLCGLGFDAQVAHHFAQQTKRGLTTYIQQSIQHFIAAKPYGFTIVHQAQSFTTEAFFISIANSNQFGNQFTIAPQAALNDGLLDIVVVKKMNKLRVIEALVRQVLTGKVHPFDMPSFHQKRVLYFQTKELLIHNLQQAPLHIDGDPAATAAALSIRIIPNAFKLLQPYC